MYLCVDLVNNWIKEGVVHPNFIFLAITIFLETLGTPQNRGGSKGTYLFAWARLNTYVKSFPYHQKALVEVMSFCNFRSDGPKFIEVRMIFVSGY